MTDTEINIVGILRPKPGKMDRVSFSPQYLLNTNLPHFTKLRFQQLLELLSSAPPPTLCWAEKFSEIL
jgi:hypothetical protein